MTEIQERYIGPYKLIGLLGRGGSSTVYEAVDERDGHLVALKVVSAASDAYEEDTLTRRMERSSRAMASLDYPNVARVYETGEAPLRDGTAGALPSRYIAMERVEGTTLRERLKSEGGPLSLAQAADVLQQVARGLDAVHAAAVIHRDIKPSNILLGADGVVKLTDFGIARRANDTMVTLDGVMIGSPHYISPEQTANQPATPASDLWSLGIVLYEMVVGKVPFAGENIPATLYQIAHSDMPALPPHLTPAVREVLTRALARDPDSRFPNAVSLAEAFRQAVEPAPAVAPLPLGRVRHSPARRSSFTPMGLALALIGGVALVAGGFLAAPKLTTTMTDPGTSVVSDFEKNPATPPVGAAGNRERRPLPKTPQTPRAPARVPAPAAKASQGVIPSAVLTPSPSPSPVTRRSTNRTVAIASPPPVSVIETTLERIPALRSPTPTPGTKRRQDMPVAVAPAPPPLEISRDLPDLDIEPLPRATPRPTPVPATPPPTPAPTPIAITTPAPAASRASDSDEEGVEAEDPNTLLAGNWRGTHTGHAARLVLRPPNRDTGEFRGVLTVQMPSGPVRIAITGQAFDDGGITIRETRVLQAAVERAWDVGTNTGIFDPDALTLSGKGRDKRGRTYRWSFQR